ncbi:MAG TPA: hypothetical protein VME66_14805 [Candidatus Acidoferrales bacterium]|nr:hypothetical protein [Candidatus Acidoferrales bacterium]
MMRRRAHAARQERGVLSRLRLPLDIIIAPGRAIARIIETREWLTAYAIVVILGLLSTLLLAPALAHIVVVYHDAQPSAAGQSASQAVQTELYGAYLEQFFEPLFLWSFGACIMWIASMEPPGRVLGPLISLNANAGIPVAIGGLFLAFAIRAHDPASFKTVGQLFLALPDSLASLRPQASDRELAFLSFWTIFQVWSLILMGYGFAAIAKTGLTRSLFLSFGIGLSIALLGVLAG